MVSVGQEMVAMQSAAMAAYVGYTRNAVALRAPCALTTFSETLQAKENLG